MHDNGDNPRGLSPFFSTYILYIRLYSVSVDLPLFTSSILCFDFCGVLCQCSDLLLSPSQKLGTPRCSTLIALSIFVGVAFNSSAPLSIGACRALDNHFYGGCPPARHVYASRYLIVDQTLISTSTPEGNSSFISASMVLGVEL